LYRAGDPAVLRLLKTSLDAARTAEVPAGVCGQMCAVPMYTMLLLGLGLRSLSVPPSAVPEIKQVIRSVSVAQCEVVARRALMMDGAREIEDYLRDQLKQAAPELALS
jgi:phosphotransferase system enzyme I (PtsI)